jgi:hypothetical protein
LTKPIHPRSPIVIHGQAPKRIRRTKSQMAEARQRAEIEALLADARVIAENRLKSATPGQKRVATRIVNRVVNGPKYRWS